MCEFNNDVALDLFFLDGKGHEVPILSVITLPTAHKTTQHTTSHKDHAHFTQRSQHAQTPHTTHNPRHGQ